MKKFLTSTILVLGLFLVAANCWAAGDPIRGKSLYSICVACHGANGEGKKINNAPRIAGQYDWYVQRQLTNYRDGIRGVHIDDITGMQMRSIAITLKTDQDIIDVTSYVSTLKSEPTQKTMEGDLEAGKQAYATCLACHGVDGNGNKALNSPRISGLQDWYIARQLNHFKIGARGRLKNDLIGQQMRPMAMGLDEKAINNLAVYISSMKGDPSLMNSAEGSSGSTQSTSKMLASVTHANLQPGNPIQGKNLFGICVACHGSNGEGKKINNAPRISGQHEWYIQQQLINYRDGIRGIHIDDITGMQMRSIAITLKTDQDISDVSAYLATLKSETPRKTIEGDLMAGKQAYGTCVACHGGDGNGNKALNAPKIAGLQDWYIARQLNHFKIGARGRIQRDLTGQQMRPMAMALDETAINNLAFYITSLEGSPGLETTVAEASSSSQPSMSQMMASATPASLNTSEPLYSTCTACHGENGEGKQWLGAPRLSGQHDWYLERQLKNWQEGIRGTHPQDVYGFQMRPMAMVLSDENAIRQVVEYIGGLESPKPEATFQGDLQAGQGLYATCAACHGPGGMGIQALNAPKIAGLPDWYLARQLNGFKNGHRGENTRDVYGQQMRPMAMALTDQEAVNNVTAYIASFSDSGATPAVAATTAETTATPVANADDTQPGASETQADTVAAAITSGSAEAGAALYTTCLACHGADGAGNQALNAPRIAGQSSWYLSNQLKGFKAGYRGSKPEDVYGMQMRPMSMTLADDQAVANVAAYVGTLNGPVSPATLDGNAEAGKALYVTCVACHGAEAKGNEALKAPTLKGLQDWYIVRQLKNFKAGIRGTHPQDVSGQTMRPMSMILADEKAMKDVTAYVLSLQK